MFDNITFSSKVRFLSCNFISDFIIKECQYNSDFMIRNCTFNGKIDIQNSSFKDFIFWGNNIHSKNSDFSFHFSWNNVSGTTSLTFSQFSDNFLIKFSRFLGDVEVVNVKPKSWHIYGIDFSSASRVSFRNIDFTNVYFLYSRLTEVDFIGIKWKFKKKRIIIGDEKAIHGKEIPNNEYPIQNFEDLTDKYSILQSLYLQLCASYDRTRLFSSSEGFYVSAMEMKRQSKGSWLKRNLLSLVVWYKYSSLYGRSAERSFWGIILIIVLSSFLISFDPDNKLNMTLINSFNFKTLLLIFKILFEATKVNLFSLIHPAEWALKDEITLTAFITSWERILVIVFGTFFLLAVKRQFRRS